MSLKRPSFNLYMFTHNLSEYFLTKECEKLKKFTKIKASIGELQVLDTLNRLGGRFFSRFSIAYYGKD
ncbi:7643_t:CDS:1, partial [Gigaspora rosea]